MARDAEAVTAEARTIDVAIALPWRDVYEKAWRPDAFARWASGLAKGSLREKGGAWLADGPDQPVRITFTPHNAFGVMDHYVDTGGDTLVYIPLRVIENGADGALVTLTVFRQPDMDDAIFARDCDWVRRDLEALRDWITAA